MMRKWCGSLGNPVIYFPTMMWWGELSFKTVRCACVCVFKELLYKIDGEMLTSKKLSGNSSNTGSEERGVQMKQHGP